jgi:hypothetical protein
MKDCSGVNTMALYGAVYVTAIFLRVSASEKQKKRWMYFLTKLKMQKDNLLTEYSKVKEMFRKYFIEYFMEDELEEDDFKRDDIYWIGGGSTLEINEYYVSFENIKDIIELDIPVATFHDWYNYVLDNEFINLESYFKIRGNGTHEDFVEFQEEQDRMRNSPEHKAETEKVLQELKDKFIKDIS